MYRSWLWKIFSITPLIIHRIWRLTKKNIDISIIVVNYIYPLLIDFQSVLYLFPFLILILKMLIQNPQHSFCITRNSILKHLAHLALLLNLLLLSLPALLTLLFLQLDPPIIILQILQSQISFEWNNITFNFVCFFEIYLLINFTFMWVDFFIWFCI